MTGDQMEEALYKASLETDARFYGDLGGDESHVDQILQLDHVILADLAQHRTRILCHGDIRSGSLPKNPSYNQEN